MRSWPAAIFILAGVAACAPAPRPRAHPAQPCEHGACPAPYTCRYTRAEGKLEGHCQLETGRCNSDMDCAPTSQRCQRFGPDPGVCRQLR